jgi:hypothetical protein
VFLPSDKRQMSSWNEVTKHEFCKFIGSLSRFVPGLHSFDFRKKITFSDWSV